jgi:hypothetical protein
MFQHWKRLNASGRGLEQGLVQAPARRSLPLEPQAGCFCWQPDYVRQLLSFGRLKVNSPGRANKFD